YPPTFVLTSTRDDRVHPGHARKFTAAMESLPADVRYWENIEGGHGGAATNEQAARMNALLYTFLGNTIGPGSRPCQRGAAGCRCGTAGPAREDRSRPRHRRALADLRAVRPVRAGLSAAAAQRPDDRLSGVLGRGPAAVPAALRAHRPAPAAARLPTPAGRPTGAGATAVGDRPAAGAGAGPARRARPGVGAALRRAAPQPRRARARCADDGAPRGGPVPAGLDRPGPA